MILITLFSLFWLHATDPNPTGAICRDLFREVALSDQLPLDSQIQDLFSGKTVVAILGSSRLKENTPEYQTAYEIAKELGQQDMAIVTGGGPGIMDAANRGAHDAGALSVGFELNSPWARHPTAFLDHLFIFNDLQARKKAFMDVADAWIVMPGGLGSLDEVFSIVGAMYSGQIPKKPLVLVGRAFWQPLLQYIRDIPLTGYGTIRQEELDYITIVDSSKEATRVITIRLAERP